MITIPAIELRGGSCVVGATAPSADQNPAARHPVNVARGWAIAGFRHVHVSDLDRSVVRRAHDSLVEEIIRDGSIAVQAVIDTPSVEDIDRVMDAGAERVVVHARAIEDAGWLEAIAYAYPGAAIVATGTRGIRGASRAKPHGLPDDIFDLVRELEGIPLGGLLVAIANSNGTANAVELAALEDVVETADLPVFTTGGVSSMDDLRALEHRGVSAAVLGPVLYSGGLDPVAVAREFGG